MRDKSLSGIRVLVGRARHQAGALSAELRKRGARVIEIPFIEIRHPHSFRRLDAALRNLAAYDWLVLTSVNGVEAMWQRMAKLRLNRRALAHARIAAIGPATRRAIEERGMKVSVVPKEYVAESVVHSLRKKVIGKRVLLVRARIARDIIPRELRRMAERVDVVEAYRTVAPASSRKRLRSLFRDPTQRPHIVTFTSSSTVKNFADLLGSKLRPGGRARAEILTASIGPITSSTLRSLGFRVDLQARVFTIPGLVDAIVRRVESHLR